MLAFGLFCAVGGIATLFVMAPVFGVFMFICAAVCFVGAFKLDAAGSRDWKVNRALYDFAIERWNRAYYCTRHDLVFVDGDDFGMDPTDFTALLLDGSESLVAEIAATARQERASARPPKPPKIKKPRRGGKLALICLATFIVVLVLDINFPTNTPFDLVNPKAWYDWALAVPLFIATWGGFFGTIIFSFVWLFRR